jgi:hypothetical protein
VVEQDDGHGEGDGHKRDDQVLQLGKEEREKQKPRRSRQRYQMGFYFGTQDTIEGVSVFRIDNNTIKRENLWLIGYRVPLGDVIVAYALGT